MGLLLSVGCEEVVTTGNLDISSDSEQPRTVTDEPQVRRGTRPREVGKLFVMNNNQLNLLPFTMRLRRVAAVLGVSIDNPLLDGMRAARISLGDYDFATGVAPDRAWTPSRMVRWVEVVLPICHADTFTARYGTLPEGLSDLISEAFGRDATEEDLQDAQEIAATLTDANDAHEATCLAVLSSAEFVLQ